MNTKLISRAISLLAVISLLVSPLMLAQAYATPVPDDQTSEPEPPPPQTQVNGPRTPTAVTAAAICANWVHGIESSGNTDLYVFWGDTDGSLTLKPTHTQLTGQEAAGGFGSIAQGSFPGDVNGDGLTDWVYAYESTANDTMFYVYLGQSDGYFVTTPITTHITSDAPLGLIGSDGGNVATYMGDVNNDGHDDWVHANQSSQGDRTYVYALLGQFDGTFGNPVETFDDPGAGGTGFGLAGGWNTGEESSGVADVNGDGYADWIHVFDNGANDTDLY
ncbi:MAG: VCBS repeat-containing protein, partial [Chloroflexi bacterium]|nr:VCBS repeat-containing protein [Chloroflexota bacterium]